MDQLSTITLIGIYFDKQLIGLTILFKGEKKSEFLNLINFCFLFSGYLWVVD